MQLLRALSIRIKLIALVSLAVLGAQIFISCVLLWQEASRYGLAKRDSMLSAAQVLSAGVAPAVVSGNRLEIRTVLRAIGRIPGLLYVGVEDASGRELTDLGATEQLVRDLKFSTHEAEAMPLRALLRSRTAELEVPIVSGGLTVGRLRLVSDTSDLPAQLWSALSVTFYGALVALVLALLIALRLQRSITRPLTMLTRSMARVGSHHDYSTELKSQGNDEISVLVRGFNTMIADIRERDGKLARHRENLEQEVIERTQDYRDARDAAEAANNAKSDFLATMSHEIRTPMNGILVMADLLAGGDLPPRSRRYAEVIARSGQSLVAIINDILDFSKIEAGKLDVEQLAVEAADCAENAVNLFGERAQSKRLDLIARIDVDAPQYAVADPVRLNQVLANLVNNALKFTEAGSVTLRVGQSSGRVVFSVSDTGIGIAADKITSIFSAFSQADQTTTRRFGGTGLGLSIAQRLVSAMGGEITVTSQLGKGSVFSFSLPAAQDSQASAWPLLTDISRKQALICVSGQATCDALSYYLVQAGFDVSVASTETFATQVRTAGLIAAGVKELESLEENAVRGGATIIALAGLGEAGLERLEARGLAHVCLEVPLSRQDICAVLQAVCEGRPVKQANKSTWEAGKDVQFPGARVLVVDDGAVNREVAQEALRRFGIIAELACDGLEAVSLCASHDYDIVLMDGSMPGMDGFEATRKIRGRESEAGSQRQIIVAVTAHVVGRAADGWRECGMDGVLHKPFTMASMTACLSQFLTGQAAANQTTQSTFDAGDGVLDFALVEQLRDMAALGRSDFVLRVSALYRDHAPSALADIEAAWAVQDMQALSKAAHALKSMSYNVGAKRVGLLADELELQAGGSHMADADTQIKSLREAIAEACSELAAIALAA